MVRRYNKIICIYLINITNVILSATFKILYNITNCNKLVEGGINLNNQDISSYYPAGQRILKRKGYDEYNYRNFIKVFSEDIKVADRTILASTNTTRIQDNIENNEGKQSFLAIFYYLLLLVLVASLYNLYNAIISSFNFENMKYNEGSILNLVIALFIFFVIFIITWKVKKEELRSKRTATAGKLRVLDI